MLLEYNDNNMTLLECNNDNITILQHRCVVIMFLCSPVLYFSHPNLLYFAFASLCSKLTFNKCVCELYAEMLRVI